jgi:hypothetical protein
MLTDFESFEEAADVTDADLAGVADLARFQLEKEKQVEDLEAELKRAKAELRKVQETDLPELLAGIGLSEIVLSNGARVTVNRVMYASIPKKYKHKAAQWLIDNGQGALVKNDVSIVLEKGEFERLQRLSKMLDSSEFNEYTIIDSMNTGSVKAVLKELDSQGVDVPFDMFGARYVNQSKIKI